MPLRLLQAGHSSLPLRKLESDTDIVVAAGTGAPPAAFILGLCRLRGILSPPAQHDHAAGGPFFVAATTVAGGPFFVAATKIRIRYRHRCSGGDRRHSGGFLLRIMPPSWHPVSACTARPCCRRAILCCRDDGTVAILEISGFSVQRFWISGPNLRIDA